jgi:hypothetical protein
MSSTGTPQPAADEESIRLAADRARTANWSRWGPYLADRQWGTVREDYSADGDVWDFFPHDHARSRAYRWGEDGLLGISDREGRLCFAIALWNERDPILKERLFGLSGPEGNHGEDVKECYYHLEATPTASLLHALYKYPQAEFPYAQLVEGNRARGRDQPELELADLGVFEGGRYFDVEVEYAKAAPDDVVIRISAHNRGPEAAPLHILPTLWFRNTWSWGRHGEGYWPRPRLQPDGGRALLAEHASLGRFRLERIDDGGVTPRLLVTDNETNTRRLYGVDGAARFCKDAFHDAVVRGHDEAVNAGCIGTKAAWHHRAVVDAGGTITLRLRLCSEEQSRQPLDAAAVDAVLADRSRDADAFYAGRIPAELDDDARAIARHAYAGLIWSRQFYNYGVQEWLDGDPSAPPPPPQRRAGRNADWKHLYNRDVISMPDGWEYPWFAAWDLGFHCVAFSRIDPEFAKAQLVLLLREWYMHPNGQLPAYEFAFGDVNPPVHAWAVWRVYKTTGARGHRDRLFLERCFHKLLLNFTWWVNRKDPSGNNLFAGGFLGLDNIGVFDRNQQLPGGAHLAQADGTAWMAFYCTTMLSIALELAAEDPAYEDVASKFFEHFVAITDAMNYLAGNGLWDEQDGFYYDQVVMADGSSQPVRLRSGVGFVPLFAAEIIEDDVIARLPGFAKRMRWFLENRADLARCVAYMESPHGPGLGRRLLAIPTRSRLERVVARLLDESEFLSPHGLRSLSAVYGPTPFTTDIEGQRFELHYTPGESDTYLFGGNSNWRGPVWFPLNYLLIEALERYHHFYGDTLQVEFPTGSGVRMNLQQVARQLSRRLVSLFTPDATGRRPWHGDDSRYATDPHWRGLPLFHEYFHGDTGRGCGASHQTGWTALVARSLDDMAESMREAAVPASVGQ